MVFRMLRDGPTGAISYVLADPARGEAVVVDPRPHDVALLRALLDEQRVAARWLLATHHHGRGGEHALRETARALGAGVAGPSPAPCCMPFGDEHLVPLATPGHTAGCISYQWRDRVLCGDLLGGCPDQPRPAQPQALWHSVTTRLFRLPGETLLFTAHERQGRCVATVDEVRRLHPWFGTASRDECLRRLQAAVPLTETEIAR